MKKGSYDKEIVRMFKDIPGSELTANRVRAIRFLIKDKFPADSVDKQTEIVEHIVYLDRKLRRLTENLEVELKKTLSDKYIQENIHG